MNESVRDIVNAVAQQTAAFASAWSEAGVAYAQYVKEQGATRVLTETERATAQVEALGKQFRELADRSQAWADAARGTGIGQIMQRYAERYAGEANKALDGMIDARARLGAIASEHSGALRQQMPLGPADVDVPLGQHSIQFKWAQEP